MKGGELGSLPVVIGLIVIWTIFQLQNDRLPQRRQPRQHQLLTMSATGMIAIGIVFVLLLGEIDLSVGSVSGVSASTCSPCSRSTTGMNDWLAVLVAIVTGVADRRAARLLLRQDRRPRPSSSPWPASSAGTVCMLWLLGEQRHHQHPDRRRRRSACSTSVLLHRTRPSSALRPGRARGGRLLPRRHPRRAAPPRGRRRAVPAAQRDRAARRRCSRSSSFAAAVVLNHAPGSAAALVIFLAALVIMDFVLRRTTYGRKIFAVGGGIEAARRAGINVADDPDHRLRDRRWLRGDRRYVLRRPDRERRR